MANITPSEIGFRLGLLLEGAKTLTAEAERVEQVCAKIAARRKAELGVQEPPQDPRIFNRRQPDGSFRPLSEFFAVDDRDD